MAEEKHVLLYSWFCPFAQRAWIAILEKQIPFELVEVDPYKKPTELLSANPRGLVPTIVQPDGKSVYESSVCIEYLDELKPDTNPLLPKSVWERARVRIWSDYISKYVVSSFYKLLMNNDETLHEELEKDYLNHLQTLEAEFDDDGPFFMGKSLGMVDIMLWPYFYRTELILKTYRGTDIQGSNKLKKLCKMQLHGCQHPSIQPTIPLKEENLIAKYKRYVDGSANTLVATAIRKGSTLP